MLFNQNSVRASRLGFRASNMLRIARAAEPLMGSQSLQDGPGFVSKSLESTCLRRPAPLQHAVRIKPVGKIETESTIGLVENRHPMILYGYEKELHRCIGTCSTSCSRPETEDNYARKGISARFSSAAAGGLSLKL